MHLSLAYETSRLLRPAATHFLHDCTERLFNPTGHPMQEKTPLTVRSNVWVQERQTPPLQLQQKILHRP